VLESKDVDPKTSLHGWQLSIILTQSDQVGKADGKEVGEVDETNVGEFERAIEGALETVGEFVSLFMVSASLRAKEAVLVLVVYFSDPYPSVLNSLVPYPPDPYPPDPYPPDPYPPDPYPPDP